MKNQLIVILLSLISCSAIASDFDYYVLVLSWSPDFCATNPKATKDPQCSVGSKYGFVLHGLWPQYETGYPQSCSTVQLSDAAKTQCDIFPSPKLCQHEWQKHGTCSGLDATGYLSLSAKLKKSVVIPDAYQMPETTFRTTVARLKADFVAKNSGFTTDSVAPYCSGSGRFLKEVFFCYDKAHQSRACSSEVLKGSAKSCAQEDGFVVRNVR